MTTSFEAQASLQLDSAAQDLLFRQARSANAFTDEPVTDEQLRAIYDLVKWAPTSMNNQPLRIVVLRSEEAKARLLPHLAEGNRAKTASAPAVALLAADVDFHDELPRLFPHFPGARDLFSDEAARAGAAELNASLQVGYTILGIRAAGLAAGPMTGFDARRSPGSSSPTAAIVSWWPSTSAHRPRTPGSTDCPGSTTTRSSPPFEGDRQRLPTRRSANWSPWPSAGEGCGGVGIRPRSLNLSGIGSRLARFYVLSGPAVGRY